MKEIQLTRGYVTVVNDPDFDRVLAAGPWHVEVNPKKRTAYAARTVRKANGKQATQYLHRFLLGLTDPRVQVDHKDKNGLNNTRKNLRVATHEQNRANIRKPRCRGGCSSQHKGVSWYKTGNKWVAQVGINGKRKNLGYFTSEFDAALAYDSAARKYFGEFAQTNF